MRGVEKTLGRLEGVEEVAVYFGQKRAEVVVSDSFQLDSAELKKALKSAGFGLEGVKVIAEVVVRKEGEALYADLGNRSFEVISNEVALKATRAEIPASLELVLHDDSGEVKLEAVARRSE